MVTLADLKLIRPDVQADKLYRYLKNKSKGGTNNYKGNLYEDYFAAYKIAQFWDEDPVSTLFSAQEFCFIDDLVIRMNDKTVFHYQLKDVQIISWKSGKHSLENDFIYQNELYRRTSIKGMFFMVVSGKSLARQLKKTRSKELARFVIVTQFPAAESINRLLLLSKEFRTSIANLCAINNPQTDKLETIAAQILGFWVSLGKTGVSIGQLKAKCLASSPHFFKDGGNHLSKELSGFLSSIKDLTFTISSGTLEWEFNSGTDKGVLPYKIGTKEFNKFENDLLTFPLGVAFEHIEHFFI